MNQVRGFSLAREFLASLVVFLVALPLCLGISVACGVPPHKGLISGVIGGIVIGALAGCRLQVSGPAAGLTVTVIELVQNHGLAALGPVVAAAGLVQLIAGSIRIGWVFQAVSPAVIRGMMTGIGVIIVLSQLHIVLDHTPSGGAIANIVALPEAFASVVASGATQHRLAAAIGLLTVVIMFVWRMFKLNLRLGLPEALPAIGIATLVAWCFGLNIQRVDVPDSLGEMFALAEPSAFASLASLGMLKMVLTLSLILSAQTLLSSASVDQITRSKRSDYDKELRAQGIGNLLCGLFGALPCTGVIVRSKANIEAGATTRISGVLHGVWLLLAVAAVPWLLEIIPTCTLAALLVVTGLRLIEWSAVYELRRFGWGEVIVFGATVGLIVTTDLLVGVGVGLLLSLSLVVWKVLHVKVQTVRSEGRIEVLMSGAATFISKPHLLQALDALPATAEVHLHFEGLLFIDHACWELINDWAARHEKSGGKVVVDWRGLNHKVTGNQDDEQSG